MNDELTKKSWQATLKGFTHPRVVTLLFLGFSAGIPLLLIFSSLSLWLREAGVERATVTYFSWAALGFSFKFVWAPLVDHIPVPLLTQWLGRRRGWMLFGQLAIILSIGLMASVDPQASSSSLTLMAMAAVMLGFSAATQDIAIDAYRIESAEPDLQALMSATYIAGYRIGMLVSGAGSLFIAHWLGSNRDAYSYQAWQSTYLLMAMVMLVGVITTLIIREPKRQSQFDLAENSNGYSRILLFFVLVVGAFIASIYLSPALPNVPRLLLAIAVAWVFALGLVKMKIIEYSVLNQIYLAPIQDFFQRYGLSLACLLLALVGLYRISDIVLGVISNVFYQDLGFTKPEIASVVKTFGLLMTIVGGFMGGLLSMRFGVIRVLFLGGLLSAVTNLLFMVLASKGHDITWLYIVISADNLSAGIASAAFVAFLSSLTNISFTATQYAIFTSLMTFLPKVLGGYSGTMVDAIGYSEFFLATALMGIPVLVLIAFIGRRQQFSFQLRD
ncbi:MAG: PAT family beta-lactamase induction signal transducer AmpG [Urechidicola sp.]|jgi:PAT family beta-lactamase induction signal transducer AmpG